MRDGGCFSLCSQTVGLLWGRKVGVACFNWAAVGWFLGSVALQRCRAVPRRSSCLLPDVPKCSWGARSSRVHGVLPLWLRALFVTSWALDAFPKLRGAPSCLLSFLWLMGAWARAWLVLLSPGSACPPSSVTWCRPGQLAGGALGSGLHCAPDPGSNPAEPGGWSPAASSVGLRSGRWCCVQGIQVSGSDGSCREESCLPGTVATPAAQAVSPAAAPRLGA